VLTGERVQGAYLLTNAGLQLLGGRAADLFGRRRVFLLGTLLFGLSSLTCGLAHSGWQLLLAQGAQGIGAAMMFPAAISLLTTTFAEGPERTKALAVFSAMAGAGFSCGLVVGGLLTTFISWHWIFFVNVPPVALIVFLARLVVPEDRPAEQARSSDLAGALTVTAGLLLLVYTITQATERGATLARTIGLFLLAFTLLVMFVGIERRASAPLMPLRLFQSSTLCAANASFSILLGTLFGFLFLFTFALQDMLHYSPLGASLALLPGSLLSLLASRFLAPVLVNWLGMKLSSAIGLFCMMGGLVLFMRIGTGSDYLGGGLPSLRRLLPLP
jgi:MFS family permease